MSKMIFKRAIAYMIDIFNHPSFSFPILEDKLEYT